MQIISHLYSKNYFCDIFIINKINKEFFMAYINSPTNVITVDTILTKKGRDLLSAGQPLNITKFALSDDEIDYSLWNTGHPSGSDYYGVAIESLPLIEAVPDESKLMKSKLVTLPAGTTTVPIIGTSIPNITFASVINSATAIGQSIAPFTQNGNNDTLGYQFTIMDPQYFQYIQNVVPVGTTSSTPVSAETAAAMLDPVQAAKNRVNKAQNAIETLNRDGTNHSSSTWIQAMAAAQNELTQATSAFTAVQANPSVFTAHAAVQASGIIVTKNMGNQAYTIISKQIKIYPVVGPGAAAYYGAYALAGTQYVETIITISGRETGGYTTVKVRINFA
jgi:hypothetical protein